MFVALVAFVLALTQSFLGFNENGVGWLVGTRTESSAIDSDGNAESNIDHAGYYIYDSTGAAQYGGSCASSHALGTGDSIDCNDREIDGVLYVDDDVIIPNGSYVQTGNTRMENNAVRFGSGPNIVYSADRSGAEPSLAISMYTGDASNAGNYASGPITIKTGDTTTDGNTGAVVIYTGAAGAGAADAGDIQLAVHGAPGAGTDAMTIDGASGQVQIDVGLTMASYTGDPCGSLDAGSIWYNSTSGIPCYCNNAGADLKVADDAACF